MFKKLNLALIFGGKSGEHEVSLSSAISVISFLDKEKYNIVPIVITKKGNWLVGLKAKKYLEIYKDRAGKENGISVEESQFLVESDAKITLNNFVESDLVDFNIDLVLPILHGPYGEDGKLQGMLDMLNLPYVFSEVLAHSLGMNKTKAKAIAKSNDVLVPKEIVLDSVNDLKLFQKDIIFPLVIKPNELGSSVGISIVKSDTELKRGVSLAFEYGNKVILEEYIKGRELTVTIMGDKDPKALAVTEIIPLISEFYDYKAKYEDGGSKHICPAKLTERQEKNIKKSAIKVFNSIGCKDLARTDFILKDGSDDCFFIDINTIPGMTKTSLAPEAAKFAGMNFTTFLDKLIEFNT